MNFTLPTYDVVMKLHDLALELSGGLQGILHPSRIHAAIHRPNNHMAYNEKCDIHLVCAILLDSLARGHAFTEGNKRTALLTVLLTYKLNGVDLSFTWVMNKEYKRVAVWVVKEKPEVKEIADKLEALAEEFRLSLLQRIKGALTDGV